MSLSELSVAVVGASGAVGREALSILEDRSHPREQIRLFGSSRSAGQSIPYAGDRLTIERYAPDLVAGSDASILCTSADFSRHEAPTLRSLATTVIDNSSAWRADPDVPLVIPEINGDTLSDIDSPRLIANPNCSTIMMLLAIEPIRRRLGIRSITVSTYQAVSGAGQPAIAELRSETERSLRGLQSSPVVFPTSCAFNLFPHESERDPATGFRTEELKMVSETHRITGDTTIDVLPTCVRVPVERCHAQSIVIETATPSTATVLERLLASCPHIDLDTSTPVTPLNTQGTDRVRVGPVRASITRPTTRFALWACCDQLRKGAALNALQVLDTLHDGVQLTC
ncbi:MAG: aspartate-semialdehyde dehydrogenase [Phycisphaerales bacterium JB043]